MMLAKPIATSRMLWPGKFCNARVAICWDDSIAASFANTAAWTGATALISSASDNPKALALPNAEWEMKGAGGAAAAAARIGDAGTVRGLCKPKRNARSPGSQERQPHQSHLRLHKSVAHANSRAMNGRARRAERAHLFNHSSGTSRRR